MSFYRERIRLRIPQWGSFVRRALNSRHDFAYDILPWWSLGMRDALAKLVAAISPKTPGFAPPPEAQRLAAEMWRDGYSSPLPPVPDDQLREMRDYFEALPCHDVYRPHLGRFRYDQVPSDEVNVAYYDYDEIVRAPHVFRIFNDPLVLQIAEIYLGCKPVLDNIGASWSFPGRTVAKGAQRHHRDLDTVRGFKMFIYLTDVDEDSGPHIFIKGSHRSTLLTSGRAQTDDEIFATFGRENEVIFTAKAGTRFCEDIYGYHKGPPPVSKPRLLVAAEYNVHLCTTAKRPGKPILAPAEAPGCDPYINQAFVHRA